MPFTNPNTITPPTVSLTVSPSTTTPPFISSKITSFTTAEPTHILNEHHDEVLLLNKRSPIKTQADVDIANSLPPCGPELVGQLYNFFKEKKEKNEEMLSELEIAKVMELLKVS